MAKIDPNEDCPCGSGQLFKDCHGPKVKKTTTPTITKEVKLQVIPEPDPETASVFHQAGEGTIFFRGTECGTAMVCGKCGSHLAVGMPRSNITGIVLRCNNCGSYNLT
jgi:hypothetical protein